MMFMNSGKCPAVSCSLYEYECTCQPRRARTSATKVALDGILVSSVNCHDDVFSVPFYSLYQKRDDRYAPVSQQGYLTPSRLSIPA
eukprot:scaffold471633_cov43-Prasinocladus_malaysianus.AAC.2